jgi:hypothetical protein
VELDLRIDLPDEIGHEDESAIQHPDKKQLFLLVLVIPRNLVGNSLHLHIDYISCQIRNEFLSSVRDFRNAIHN